MKFVGVFKCNSACGHWDGLGGPYKYHPTVGIKKFKRLLQHHFDVITVKEWNTSSICPSCNGKVVCEKRNGQEIRGLLWCEDCQKYWARDYLGARNILRNAYYRIENGTYDPQFEVTSYWYLKLIIVETNLLTWYHQ